MNVILKYQKQFWFTPGAPLYNVDECAYFILQKLKTKFKVHYLLQNIFKKNGHK